jgi:hypothetical protein
MVSLIMGCLCQMLLHHILFAILGGQRQKRLRYHEQKCLSFKLILDCFLLDIFKLIFKISRRLTSVVTNIKGTTTAVVVANSTSYCLTSGCCMTVLIKCIFEMGAPMRQMLLASRWTCSLT